VLGFGALGEAPLGAQAASGQTLITLQAGTGTFNVASPGATLYYSVNVLAAGTGAFSVASPGATFLVVGATIYEVTLTDGVRATDSDALEFLNAVVVTENLRATDILRNALGFVVRDVLTATETTAIQMYWGVSMADIGKIADTPQANSIFDVVLADSSKLVGAFAVAFNMQLADAFGISMAQNIVRGVLVLEQLGIRPQVLDTSFYSLSVTERARFAASLALFIGADLHDAFSIYLYNQATRQALANMGETIKIDDTALYPNLIFNLTMREDANITPTQLLHMVFNGRLAEDMQLTAAYVAPGGNFTTWAINTRSSHVTEYTNYEFSSFTQIGIKYIATAADGLYELDGSDDDGDPIIARIRTGLMQGNGSRFSGFRAAYLGLRNEGKFVFRIMTGDGKTYDYGVLAHDLQTTKVHLGKGLRSRYFSFELISEGDAFELESIELVPMMAARRV
jgi:hypothetical protein